MDLRRAGAIGPATGSDDGHNAVANSASNPHGVTDTNMRKHIDEVGRVSHANTEEARAQAKNIWQRSMRQLSKFGARMGLS